MAGWGSIREVDQMTWDIVVRNGTVIDGTGGDPRPADVAIADGRIAAVGAVEDAGIEEIDAEGHVVTPGFIDGHTHMDAQVFWDRLGTNSCWHGVTTVVMGNCGFTLAPAKADERGLVVRNLERAEDISAAAMAAGHRLVVGELQRVSRRRRRPAQGHQLRRQYRPLGPADLVDGRAGLRGRGHRPRDCGNGPAPRAGHGRRGDRDDHLAETKTTRPPTTGRWPADWRRGTSWLTW